MNKDVIYIEPEDDITDIISKLETAKEKIVALVPPKKSTVLRSAVNIKLISKAGANASKNIVLVTTDPSIIKLAANIKIPVTKNLQSAPSIPTEDDVKEEVIEEEITEDAISDKVEGKDEKVEEEEKTEEEEKAEEVAKEIEKEEEKDDTAKPEKAPKEKKEKAAPKNPVLAWIVNNKKWVGIGSGALALLVIFLVWAFVFAPAVKINVAVRTNSNNFSEMISFTNDQTKEDVESGVFYLEEIKTEQKQKAEFTATGTKNVGEKAKGQITIIGMLRGDDININSGTVLKHNDLVYYTTEDASLLFNESTPCENKDLDIAKNGCKKSVKVSIVAAEPGEKYNIEEGAGNWVISANVSAYTESGVTGGTDKNVIVVTEENVDVARGKIASGNAENLEDTKNALKEQAGDRIIIESSFKQEMSEPEVSPKVGEEVPSDTIPSITLTTTTSYFAIDKTKVEEFITNKAKIPEDQKIYAINNPFIESFMATDSAITGKIKTSYSTGSKLTENDILEMVKGKGIGDVQHALKSVSGVSKVSINQSYPWVNTVPTDSGKITIELTIEETNSQNKE